LHFWVQLWTSCLHTHVPVSKQYNLVPAQAGKVTNNHRSGVELALTVVMFPPTGSWPQMITPPMLQLECGHFTVPLPTYTQK